jgi:hypothetical protein
MVIAQAVIIEDLVRGRVAWDSDSTVGDFILLRSSGVPVYNFCVAGECSMLYNFYYCSTRDVIQHYRAV